MMNIQHHKRLQTCNRNKKRVCVGSLSILPDPFYGIARANLCFKKTGKRQEGIEKNKLVKLNTLIVTLLEH
jgi:hypothetical protein